MRLSLLVLGIIAATVCDENPAEAQIAKSIPVLAGITANKAPKALTITPSVMAPAAWKFVAIRRASSGKTTCQCWMYAGRGSFPLGREARTDRPLGT